MARKCPSSRACLAVATLHALAAITFDARGDGPGMLLTAGGYRPPEHFQAPFTRYRAVAEVGTLGNSGALHAAILESGRPTVWGGAAWNAFKVIPPEAADIVQLGVVGNFILAIGRNGEAITWPITPVWMPTEPLVDLAVMAGTAGAVGASGEVYVWNSASRLSTSPALPSCRKVALTVNWGMAVASDGTALTFGYAGNAPPFSFSAPAVRDVSVAGTISSPRAVALKTNGSLASLTTAFTDNRVYEKVCVGTSTMIALEATGVVRNWSWNGTIGEWTTPTDYSGRYREIAIAPLGVGYPMLICASDTDRNGEDDREQIIRGEIPDSNGDLIDDRVQAASILLDENLNGSPDATEVPAIAHRRKPSDLLWYAGSLARHVGMFALDRVPAQAELLREVRLRHLTEDINGVSLLGRNYTYGVWLDPNGDGSPVDAVEIFRADAPIEEDGVMRFDLGGLEIGPPGTSFFHGLVYAQGDGLPQPALFPAMSVPATSTDPFELSRRRACCWYGARVAGEAPTTAVALLRSASPWELLDPPYTGVMSNLALSWGDRRPSDCDGDGILDEYLVNGAQPFWIADLDLDRDGLLDACEQDCDLDGVPDVSELLAGAVDCNLDLIPDSCVGGAFASEQTAKLPPASGPLEFLFHDLPPASGGVSLTVEAVADLGAPTELLLLRLEGGPDEVIFGPTGTDCPATPDVVGFALESTQFEAARADGMVVIRITASALVDPAQCADGFVRVRLEYQQAATDCDRNGTNDECQHGQVDCDGNGVPDECELSTPGLDVDGNGVLDACEFDCNRDGTADTLQVASDPALDCDNSGFLDECEFTDCNLNGKHDPCELAAGIGDCNQDGFIDACQFLPDCDSDGTPDACELDCDGNGVPDECDTAGGAPDKDSDGVPDACEYARGDFDLDGSIGAPDLAYLLSVWGVDGVAIGDLNGDGVIGAQDLAILLGNWGPA